MIEVKDITKKFGWKEVLKGVSFTAGKGEITCLIGVNGVGKTTILNAIMKLTPINGGSILLDGEPITEHSFEKITFIPDAITMLPHMRIAEAMDFMAEYYNAWNQDRADDLLKFFKRDPYDKINRLPKRNTTRANLIMALDLDADSIQMDEPFSRSDQFSREQIANVFTRHLIEDRGVIITAHEIH